MTKLIISLKKIKFKKDPGKEFWENKHVFADFRLYKKINAHMHWKKRYAKNLNFFLVYVTKQTDKLINQLTVYLNSDDA